MVSGPQNFDSKWEGSVCSLDVWLKLEGPGAKAHDSTLEKND